MKMNLTLTIFGIGLLLGCAEDPLQKLVRRTLLGPADLAMVEVDFCTVDANKLQSDLKFIFVIDKSGSNIGTGSSPATDLNGFRRYAPLKAFIDQNTDDDTVFYSLINFETKSKRVQGFTNDRVQFKAIIDNEHNPGGGDPPMPADGGWTNYIDALREAYQLIASDVAMSKTMPEIRTAHYVIFFVSDG